MVIVGAAALLPPSALHAALWSKSFEFRSGVTLEVGADTGGGLRLDDVRFEMPVNAGVRAAREATVEITVSNASESSRRVGLAVALFDADGRLVGVADGGTALMPLRPGRLRAYRLVFQNVRDEAPNAETFQISVETRP